MARTIGVVSVARSDRGHLTPLLECLGSQATLFSWTPAPVLSPPDVGRAFGLGVANFTSQFTHRRPDLAVIFGDRWEQLAAACAATMLNIPLVHLHAGETTEAVIDEQCRAAISALATIHVAANYVYGGKLIAQGYKNVHILGAPGLARLPHALPRLNLIPVVLVAFHPETKNLADVPRQAAELAAALDEFDCLEVYTAPGMDAGRGAIIAEFGQGETYTDSEWLEYLGRADVIVGNSSCGIIEAPSIPLACVNIGDRQKGRLRASSVIDVPHDGARIRAAIALALNPEWRQANLTGVNPYGDRGAAERIAELVRTVSL